MIGWPEHEALPRPDHVYICHFMNRKSVGRKMLKQPYKVPIIQRITLFHCHSFFYKLRNRTNKIRRRIAVAGKIGKGRNWRVQHNQHIIRSSLHYFTPALYSDLPLVEFMRNNRVLPINNVRCSNSIIHTCQFPSSVQALKVQDRHYLQQYMLYPWFVISWLTFSSGSIILLKMDIKLRI